MIDNELKLENQSEETNEEEIVFYINSIFEQQEKIRVINSISNKVRSSLSLDKVLHNILLEIRSLINIERSGIFLFDKENNSIENNFRGGEDCTTKSISITQLSESAISYFFDKKCQFVDSDASNFFSDKELLEKITSKINITTFVATPIIYKDKFLGVIATYGEKPIQQSQLDLLVNISNQTAIAVYQAQLFEKLRQKNKNEKNRCKEANKKSALKSEFLTNMSHELRTPLNAIIGFSEILSSKDNDNLTPKQIQYINNILISGQFLLKLINELLDLSKIESGIFELNYECFNSKSAIYEVVSVLNEMAFKKNVDIKLEVENIYINADKKRFMEVMYNLINNSIKFSKENGFIIIKSHDIGNSLYVEVIDNGVGISEDQKQSVFNKYVSYSGKKEGTGLGLPLTKKIVEIHNGKIDFESKPDEVTKFWFIIPKDNVVENQTEKIVCENKNI